MKLALLRVAASAALCVAGSAHAHPSLDQAEPKVGSIVHAAPAEVRLRFNEALEPAFSSIRVLDGDGKPVVAARAQVEGEGHDVLRLALPPLRPGGYVVQWRAVSVDTHATEGRYQFTLRP